MSEFARTRRSWARYVIIGAWSICFLAMSGFHPLMLGWWLVWFVPSAIVWTYLSWMRKAQKRGDVAKIDKAVKLGNGGHIRGTELVSVDKLLARMEAVASGYAEPDLSRKVHLMLTDPKNHPRNPSLYDGWVRVAGVPVPPANENLHFALCASTGAGKSVTLRGLLADIRRRGDRAIVIDNGGEFMRDFAVADDLVLSPFDSRTVGWNLANEIRAAHDWARMSRSIIPDGHGNDRSWHEMAQTLFANIGTTVGGDNKQLLEIATGYSAKMLEPILAGTPSAVLTQDGGERLLTNIRSVYANVLASWQYMPGGDFSLRSYMHGNDKCWLFVPFQESEFGISKSLIAAWMDMLVSAGLERPEGGQQTWIILDELDTLGQLSSLIAATTKLRKRKVTVVTAFQSVSQLEEHYGQNGATTLLNCLSNKIVLRCTDAITADRMSKELGEREVWKESFSNTNVGAASSPGNQAKSQQVERLVMPSQLQNLKDLHGYIKLSGDYPVTACLASVDAGRPVPQAA